jgi:hypothetical protein
MCGSGKFRSRRHEVSGTFSGTQLMLVTLALLGTGKTRDEFFRTASSARGAVRAAQARQGVTGHHVRLVLGLSVAATAIVFGIIWILYFG